ncbi:MAG: DUF2207 domain-containing protein [Coriobacteriaceae bacterium]|nr:DUF2207 domain-containing protein [Coriobacteriaceae bacterium]
MPTRRLAALISLIAALVLVPAAAWADGFSMRSVGIEATVEPDGTVQVTEERTFTFENDVNGVFWTIPLGTNQQGRTSAVSVTGMTEAGGVETREYRREDDALSGDRGVYSVTEEDGVLTVKVFAPHKDGDQVTFTLSYVLDGAVMGWADTAELYWKYVGDGWDAPSENVSLTVTFAGAAASGVAATTGSDDANLRAWGHGPLNGNVSLAAGANSVTYTVPEVGPGTFAEARIAFPAAWVPGLAASSESRLPQILSEEQAWADEANSRRERARMATGAASAASIGLPAAFLAIVGFLKLTRGKKAKAAFDDTYFRDVPSADHPAVIAAFMHDGRVGNEAIVSTLMKLTDDKAVAISKTSRTRRGLFGDKIEEDYLLAVDPARSAALEDDIDRKALEVYFSDRAQVTFSEMTDGAKDDPEGYAARWESFEVAVKARYEARGLVASTGVGAGVAAILIGGLILFMLIWYALTAAATGFTGSLLPLAGIPLCIAGMVVGCSFRRYTQEGAELHARCLALKRWLEDFTRLGEAVPGDVVLWNKLLVLAVALGVSDRVLEELAAATPRRFEEGYAGGYYYPSWWWVTSHGSLGSPASELSAVSPLSLSELAGSSSSSGSGFGGGFSGGGGAGVGGGGGGTF